ncbi:uncharacterized protein LOC116343832 [Contarinia nasturtii]|uniref:uncharacterized protein LOC116343832 n=1 Tax=Contarinia nasturtii TaxID=265458 RepID=UPI0012D4B7F8|nr:uncharacterized protein LOC116343832 [Contarinia nasturtii]
MFRSHLRWFTILQCSPQGTLRTFCSQKTTSKPKKKSGNQVKLIGRVRNEVLSLPNGFDSFHVRTATHGLGKLIGVTHNIKTSAELIETPLPALANNDLVYVHGEIVYQNVANGKKFISLPHIFATKVIRMKNNHNSADDLEQLVKESVNEVKLLGMIGSNIYDGNATAFHIVTNSEKTEQLNKNFSNEWHRVLIFDDKLREFVRNNLKITDRLLINGEIFYNKVNLENGDLSLQGNILPNRIQKLQYFSRSDEIKPQNTEETEATAQQ